MQYNPKVPKEYFLEQDKKILSLYVKINIYV